MLIQILEVLRLLRQHKIVHADLKPQNLLLFRGLILKLTDFG
jgi:serine/threonine protein kinase